MAEQTARPVASVYDSLGAHRGEVVLDPAMFGIEPNRDVMHQVVVAHMAARRAGTANTKTRAEVRGGGRKPWRQKGLGRARHGSIRSPIWVGGGVAHGPKPRSYAQRTPRKMRGLALRSALSARASEGAVKVVSEFDWGSPKTRLAHSLLDEIGVDGKALVVLDGSEATAARSFRNLPTVVLGRAGRLNTYDILWSDTVVFSGRALEETTGLPVETLPGPYDVSEDDFVRVDDASAGPETQGDASQ
ncbi:MAG: 50S ribosomal protein L4 [bacterium]|nr:50S ribosomal protein L4 [bacterium]MDE0439036.1 50S ribosomal protein L4 [bacterium]